jgi:hypothetical protein
MGPAGDSVIGTSLPVGDPICPDGGAMFEVNGIFSYACNGAPGAAGTNGESGTTGQDATTLFGTGMVTVGGFNWTQIPGLATTVNVPADSKIVVATDGGAMTVSSVATGYSMVDIGLFIDGKEVSVRRFTLASTNGLLNAIGNWSLAASAALGEGTHTIEVKARWSGGNASAQVSGSEGNTLNRGQLTVTTLKL